jgi:hypothetical protein
MLLTARQSMALCASITLLARCAAVAGRARVEKGPEENTDCSFSMAPVAEGRSCMPNSRLSERVMHGDGG